MTTRITPQPIRTKLPPNPLKSFETKLFYKAADGSSIDANLPGAAEELARRNRAHRERMYRSIEPKKY